MSKWELRGSQPREQSVTSDWQHTQPLIDGVIIKEMRNVPTGYGYLTEMFRADWNLDSGVVDQVFQSVFEPGMISAWHAHRFTTDRLFCAVGHLRVVLYDGREHSSTKGMVNSFGIGSIRPSLIVVPPKVWHGVQNVSRTQPSVLLNAVDAAYQYEEPDHISLPVDSDQIPYSFE